MRRDPALCRKSRSVRLSSMKRAPDLQREPHLFLQNKRHLALRFFTDFLRCPISTASLTSNLTTLTPACHRATPDKRQLVTTAVYSNHSFSSPVSVTAPIADLDRATRFLTKRQVPRQSPAANMVNMQGMPANAVAPQPLPTIPRLVIVEQGIRSECYERGMCTATYCTPIPRRGGCYVLKCAD